MVPSVALLIIIIIGPQFLDVWLLGYPFIFAHIYYSNPIGFFFGLPFSNCQTMASNDIPTCPSLDVPTNPKVAGMEISSLPVFKTPGGSSDPFYGWDPPLVSLTHNANFSGASSMPLEFSSLPYPLQTHRISGTPNTMVHYQSNLDLTNMVPKVPCFESGSFSEIVDSFGLPKCAEQIPDKGRRCFPIHSSNEIEIQGTSSDGTQSQDNQISEEKTPSGKKRKRGAPEASHSASNPHKNSDGEQQRDLFGESHELQEQQNDKKQKSKQDISGVNPFGNQITKQSNKDNYPNGDAGKDIYVHRRAKRGQATNSHSLAERVRREKISDRMKMLQELVPGCNKITGKAVMLDEIINYVQSLQQQVQFLSMKLATFNPELNMNIGQLVSKDILHSRVSNTTVIGFGHGMNFSRPSPHGISQGTLASIPSTSQLQSMPHQGIWDTKLANTYNIGYGSNSANETDA